MAISNLEAPVAVSRQVINGVETKGSDQTWIIMFGKGISNEGEISKTNQLFSNQIAPSIRELLNLPQKKEEGYGIPLSLTN